MLPQFDVQGCPPFCCPTDDMIQFYFPNIVGRKLYILISTLLKVGKNNVKTSEYYGEDSHNDGAGQVEKFGLLNLVSGNRTRRTVSCSYWLCFAWLRRFKMCAWSISGCNLVRLSGCSLFCRVVAGSCGCLFVNRIITVVRWIDGGSCS